MTTDRVRRYTWWLSLVLIPFLIAASFLLYVLPGNTEQHFAWTIDPPLTALFLGSAYVGGIWFFVRVLTVGRWHRVKYGFPAVLLFATLLTAATFLHWDRFHFGHISFLTWVTLYVTTPVLVVLVLVWNWREDPRTLEETDVVLPWAVRVALALLGAAALAAGVTLFLFPAVLGPLWAWDLTPLTGRIVGAVLTLPGMVNLWLLVDARWSAFRWMFQAQLVSLLFILGALVLGGGDLQWSRPAAPLFVAGILASAVVYVLFYLWSERSLRLAEARLRA
ncbi:hypothetical protein ACFFGH_31290 [Lysobacter korlensis]|uniref:Transmembrane protein n=1 Tax=Lysobacter korlensis TaxID=553636 RepID=A0ABV6RZE2_9GAMM